MELGLELGLGGEEGSDDPEGTREAFELCGCFVEMCACGYGKLDACTKGRFVLVEGSEEGGGEEEEVGVGEEGVGCESWNRDHTGFSLNT